MNVRRSVAASYARSHSFSSVRAAFGTQRSLMAGPGSTLHLAPLKQKDTRSPIARLLVVKRESGDIFRTTSL